MDFMKWLNSLDELLYEVMSWLLFFPLTLWRSVVRPFATMAEIERQAALPDEQQYASLLSPPLFLALALLLSHGVATALNEVDQLIANQHGLAGLVTDPASALALRVIVFAAFALFFAARLVRARGVPLDRASLRVPFYEQCYPTAVFALGLGVGVSLINLPQRNAATAGALLILAACLNYGLVELRWYARALGTGYGRAFINMAIGFGEGAAFLILVGFLFTR